MLLIAINNRLYELFKMEWNGNGLNKKQWIEQKNLNKLRSILVWKH